MKVAIVTKLLSNAIRKFANQLSESAKNIQICIGTKDDSYGTPEYKLLKNYAAIKSIPFEEIYNGEDIFSFVEKAALSLMPNSMESVCSQFIANMLTDIANKNNCLPSQVQIVIWSRDVQAGQLSYHLYISDDKKIKHDKGMLKIEEILK